MSFLMGVMSLLFYLIYRMMKNPGWDDSNMTNALRLLSHVTLHPHDFAKMYYLVDFDGESAVIDRRPFWYVSKDEFSGVVKTRPPK
jgi:hypothetical protein